MKKHTRNVAMFVLVFLTFFSFSEKTIAADTIVRVTLPTFDVTINGHTIDNEYRKYPFLVYKDITYVPMTWFDSRVLGLETTWSRENGLEIKRDKVTSRYESYLSNQKNAKSYQAKVRQGTLKLNGKTIKNESEDYPFLTFNNITYFPLTWRFAHDEFGWGYEWDAVNGLRITSHNPQVKNSGLPTDAGSNGISQFQDHFYYVETDGPINQIYRTPVSTPKNKVKIFEYDPTAFERTSKDVDFRLSDDQLLMNYMIGNFQYYQMINQNGELEQPYSKLRASLDFRDTPYGKLVVNVGLPDEANGNLHLIKEDGTTQQIGDPDVTTYGQSATKDGVTPTVVVGEDVYILLKRDYPSPYVLYQMSIVTGETKPVVENVDWFVISEGKLYYTKSNDNLLYKANLDGSAATQISEYPVTWFHVINDNVFYTSQNDTGKRVLYEAKEGKDEQLLVETVASVAVEHDQLFVVPDKSTSYGALILDAEGDLLWKVEEPISSTFTSDDGWLVQSARDERIYFIR